MGQNSTRSAKSTTGTQPKQNSSTLIADAIGPEFCKSCWFERRGLVKCHDHYLCMSCLTLLLSVSDRCPVCKFPLPRRLKLEKPPSAPPAPENPPPYRP
ncbi:Z protein [Mammarenavirus gairoense]|uniref:Z protein n=1 Tax=Mammarenavirus gairoense TaxID=3052306 RepID=A0A0B4N537_9VIRU|nr:Z protein [Mammarenavirus gairoense]AIK25570.1 Z protein [Mammarenavirus gairoense]